MSTIHATGVGFISNYRGPVRGVPIIPYTYNDEVIYTLYLKYITNIFIPKIPMLVTGF